MLCRKWFLSLTVLSMLGTLVLACTSNPVTADDRAPAPSADLRCPYFNRDVRLEIVELSFHEVLPGANGTMQVPTERLDVFRIAVVTVRVTKPLGKMVSIPAASLVLHYTYGDREEAAPCGGTSSFTKSRDEERPIMFGPVGGPGWVKQSTGPRATQSEELYFEAVFQNVEPDIDNVWLCVAQPTCAPPFVTDGWKP